MVVNKRYIVCFNPKQAQKDAVDREAILELLGEQIKQGAKSLIVSKGCRKYLKLEHGSVTINMKKVKDEPLNPSAGAATA